MMLKIGSYPQNKEKYLRLMGFLKEVLNVCQKLDIDPVLDGGLAVLAHTQNTDLVIKDIDFSHPEEDYPKLAKALKDIGISAEIKEWHVLQVRRDDLKVEFGDLEYWYSNIGVPIEYDILQIDGLKIRILKLDTLIAFYKRGLDDTKDDPEKEQKYKDMLSKYNLLIKTRDNNKKKNSVERGGVVS